MATLIISLLIITISDINNQIVKIGEAGEFIYSVQNGNEYMLTLHDTDLNKQSEFVRKGNGPGELTQIDAATFSEETNHFYIIGRGKLLVLGIDGVVVTEEQLGFLNASDLIYSDGLLYIGIADIIPTGELRDVRSVMIYDLQEKNSQFVTVPINQLSISPANKVNEVPFIQFQSKLALLDNELYFIIIGNPVVYSLSGSEAVTFYQSENYTDTAYVISLNERMGTYGFRTPSIFNSLNSREDHLLISNGNLHEHVFVEHSVYIINATNGYTRLENDLGDTSDITCLNSSVAHEFIYFYDCMYQGAYVVTKLELDKMSR